MIRINAGVRRGLQLQTLAGTDIIRPTTDKIRQAIFNILLHNDWGMDLQNATILDAFAGTGAWGLEAISRGASRAVFMEHNAEAATILRNNIARCKFEGVTTVIQGNSLQPPTAQHAADIIFLDPPYGLNMASQAVSALDQAGWINKESLIIIEMKVKQPELLVVGFQEAANRTYGNTAIAFWHKT